MVRAFIRVCPARAKVLPAGSKAESRHKGIQNMGCLKQEHEEDSGRAAGTAPPRRSDVWPPRAIRRRMRGRLADSNEWAVGALLPRA